MVEWNVMTGHASQVLDDLKKKLSLYQRGKQVKIGISTDPEARWRKHSKSKKHDWEKMVVVYKTTSHKSVYFMETELISFCADKYPDKIENEVLGGGGINNPENFSNFYVYFLVK